MASSIYPFRRDRSPITLILWFDWVDTAILWATSSENYLLEPIPAVRLAKIYDLGSPSTYTPTYAAQKRGNTWLLCLWMPQGFQARSWCFLKWSRRLGWAVQKVCGESRPSCFYRTGTDVAVVVGLPEWTASFLRWLKRKTCPRMIYVVCLHDWYSKRFYR